jgi:DNA-binding transcriptional LysR family regulator
MHQNLRISLEQWQALVAVVDAGGYAQAAGRLHKSQSAITYLIKRLEEQLGVKVFEIQGRKAVLTPTGEMLTRRGRYLIQEAINVESSAHALSAGWEPVVRIASEILFPTEHLLTAMGQFSETSPSTRLEIFETVLSGTAEALHERRVDLAITPYVPSGFLGDPLLSLELVAVAHPDHPLHHFKRKLTAKDLHGHRHLLVRDTGLARDEKTTSVDVENRWIFSNFDTCIKAACQGHGFSWYPRARIASELDRGVLKPLPLTSGNTKAVTLYVVIGDPDTAGPATRHFAKILQQLQPKSRKH